ncbi:MAG: hypothetical protein F6J96_23605 [Symploca sp. SIO1C2]|nr:hypothetical protein [Symploca sp. SIO1C2]
MTKPAYHVGGCLPPDASSYVIRSADEELYQQLLSGEFCYVLNSRQMGKSSLRVQTMQRLQQEGVVCASVDITELGTQKVTPEKWYGGLTKTLVTRLKLEEKFSYRNWLKEHKDIPPVQFFREFIEEVLLTKIIGHIVIFIDEIDSVLQLSFKDDFFALIRACYNKRADNPDYNRLSFVLLGVATPGDLIADKDRTPFNIGRAIELHGFQQHEVEPLAKGLSKYSKAEGRWQKAEGNNNCLGEHDIKPESYNPNTDASYIATATLTPSSDSLETLKEILYWTGGQPFLTQKLCQMLVSESEKEHPCSVEQVVREQIISNWEASDEPEHLKTIRDRILANEQRAAYLLELYQQVWQQGEVVANNSFEEGKLQLSGLVVKHRNGSSPVLQVYNRIYYEVFNQDWIDKELALLRPYSEAFRGWVASGCEDESLLLRGNTLENAQAWAKGKNLSYQDQQFLAASQKKVIEEQLAASKLEAELERQRKDKEAAEERNRILTEANRKAQQRIQIGAVVLTVAVLGAVVSGIFAGNKVTEANSKVENANHELTQVKKQAWEEQKKAEQAQEYLALAQGERENITKKVQYLEQQQGQKSEELNRANNELVSLTQQREQAHQESQRLARQAQQATQETKQANQRLTLAQQAFQQANTKAQQAQKKLREAQERVKTADSRVQELNQAGQDKVKELEQAQRKLHIAKKEQSSAQANLANMQEKYQQTQISLAKVETEIETVSLLSKLAAELHDNGLSTEAQEAWSQASKATDEILEKEENRELKQAMLQASISLASLQLSQNYKERDQQEKAGEYLTQAKESIEQSREILHSSIAVDSLEQLSIHVHVQRLNGSWYQKNGETQKALSAYQQAFSLLDTAWRKLPNVDDIETDIPIPQYLPQQQPILSTNVIENLHEELIVLLAEADKDDSQIKESLKHHYLSEINFFMESGNWRDADQSTHNLISFSGRINGVFELDHLSCRDLATIDRLWVERSEGMFGFSVQKDILDKNFVTEPGSYDDVNWSKFHEKIGWKKERGHYYQYSEGVFSPKKARKGHLPKLNFNIVMGAQGSVELAVPLGFVTEADSNRTNRGNTGNGDAGNIVIQTDDINLILEEGSIIGHIALIQSKALEIIHSRVDICRL